MDLSKKQIAYLLSMIDEEIDVGSAYDAGFMLTEILILLRRLSDEGYCIREAEQYTLTPKGQTFLDNYGHLMTTKFKVVPLYDAKTPKITLTDIFLPEKSPTNLQ